MIGDHLERKFIWNWMSKIKGTEKLWRWMNKGGRWGILEIVKSSRTCFHFLIETYIKGGRRKLQRLSKGFLILDLLRKLKKNVDKQLKSIQKAGLYVNKFETREACMLIRFCVWLVLPVNYLHRAFIFLLQMPQYVINYISPSCNWAKPIVERVNRKG